MSVCGERETARAKERERARESERELAVAFPRVCEWQFVCLERERERERVVAWRERRGETFPLYLRVALGGWERDNERVASREV